MKKNNLHRGHVIRVLQWCASKYGRSKYNGGIPNLEFRKPRYIDELDEYGYYDDITNTIYVNREMHENVHEMIMTVIEEYVHYLQNDRDYQKLAECYSYEKHPLEKQAKKIARKDYKTCLKYLKNMHASFSIF